MMASRCARSLRWRVTRLNKSDAITRWPVPARGPLSSGSLAARGRHLASKVRGRLHLGSSRAIRVVDKSAIDSQDNPAPAMISAAVVENRRRVEEATVAACREYKPRRYAGRIDLFVTRDRWHAPHRWRTVAETVQEHDFRDFVDDLIGSHAAELAASLQGTIDRVIVAAIPFSSEAGIVRNRIPTHTSRSEVDGASSHNFAANAASSNTRTARTNGMVHPRTSE
jgi:hypothetical protein